MNLFHTMHLLWIFLSIDLEKWIKHFYLPKKSEKSLNSVFMSDLWKWIAQSKNMWHVTCSNICTSNILRSSKLGNCLHAGFYTISRSPNVLRYTSGSGFHIPYKIIETPHIDIAVFWRPMYRYVPYLNNKHCVS